MFNRKMITLAMGIVAASMATAQFKGPNSSETPYVLPVMKGVETYSLLTVGDSVNNKNNGDPYRFVGLPDGLGAFSNDDGTITVFCNHELGANVGVTRAHGAKGSFVSRWIIDPRSKSVISGQDQTTKPAMWARAAAPYGRFCSGDLAPATAFFNPQSGKGTTDRIYMNGEEVGAEGRAFAHIVTGPHNGESHWLWYHGLYSWENSVAHPNTGDLTLVCGTDDSTPGEVYFYTGMKQSTGNPIEKAGLAYGTIGGVKVEGFPVEDRTAGIPNGTRFGLHNFGDVHMWTGAKLQDQSSAAGVTKFLRPEDSAWDTQNPNVLYFVTTDRFDTVKTGQGSQIGRSRLYRLTFDDVTRPELGGVIDTILDGTEAMQMMDNICVDWQGNVLIQEDPGNQLYSARIWRWNRTLDLLEEVAKFDADRFGDLGKDPTPPFSADEESSGIIDLSEILGKGWFAIDAQAHYNRNDAELVEGGQLGLLFIP